MTGEKVLSSKTIFQGRIIKLRVDTVETPEGDQSVREIVEHGDCIAVVPIDREGNILMVKQYRHATARELLEIPAGGVEPG
jgi:ADP-ribose pyrophosphatase